MGFPFNTDPTIGFGSQVGVPRKHPKINGIMRYAAESFEHLCPRAIRTPHSNLSLISSKDFLNESS
jgi:hypothetical protein